MGAVPQTFALDFFLKLSQYPRSLLEVSALNARTTSLETIPLCSYLQVG